MANEHEKRISSMSKDELISGIKSAGLSSNIINVIGIALFLLMFNFPNLVIIIFVLVCAITLSFIYVAVTDVMSAMREELEKFLGDK